MMRQSSTNLNDSNSSLLGDLTCLCDRVKHFTLGLLPLAYTNLPSRGTACIWGGIVRDKLPMPLPPWSLGPVLHLACGDIGKSFTINVNVM